MSWNQQNKSYQFQQQQQQGQGNMLSSDRKFLNYPNQSQQGSYYQNNNNMSYQQPQQGFNPLDVSAASGMQPVNQSLSNPNNQAYYPSNYLCEEHNEAITNYCSNLECLKELCPECIDDHFDFHSSQQTVAKIESIKSVKNHCSKKLKAAVISLSEEINKTEMSYLTNPEQVIEEGVQRIYRNREKVIQQINQYYEQLEQNFKKNIHENMLKANDFTAVFDKIKNLIQELELLNNKLDVGHQVEVIKKICLLDLQALLDKFRKDIHKVIDAKDLDPVVVDIDESKQYTLQNELQKLIKISKKASEYHKMDENHFQQYQQTHPYGSPNQMGQDPFNSSARRPEPQNQQFNPSQVAQSQYIPQEVSLQNHPDPIPVNQPNYFDLNCPQDKTVMHYFLQEENESKIYTWNLRDQSFKFDVRDLADNQYIPNFHRSVTTPSGDIYLIGGRNIDQTKSNDIYKYDERSNKLQLVAKMKFPRSSHSVVYMNNRIYITGGYTTIDKKSSQITGSCEVFDVQTGSVTQIDSLKNPCVSHCLAAFNNKYLFKFGGMQKNRQMSPFIEKYDLTTDSWSVIDPKIQKQMFTLLSTGSCAQINQNQIMVFGGYNQDNQSSRQSYVFTVDEYNDQNCQIQSINYKPLPQPEGFWNNQVVIFNNTLYSLQNVASSDSDNNCLLNERKILTFEGNSWQIKNPRNQFM